MNVFKPLLVLLVWCFSSQINPSYGTIPSSKQDEKYALVRYDVTKASVRLPVGRYNHNQLLSSDVRFVQSVEVPPGYVLEVFSGKNFNNQSQKFFRGGEVDFPAQSVVFRKAGDIKSSNPQEAVAGIRYDITGASARLRPGRYTHSQLMTKDIRYVQSVQLPKGYLMIAYAGENFDGKSTKIYRTGKLDFAARSVVFRKVGDVKADRPGASELGADVGFIQYDITKANAQILPGRYSHEKLMTKKIRFIQSVQIPKGYLMEVFSGEYFDGRSQKLYRSGKPDFTAKSVIFRKVGDVNSDFQEKGDHVILFSEKNHKGTWAKLKPGKYSWEFLKDNVDLNFVRSVYVPSGYEVICYYQGRGEGDRETHRMNANLDRSAMSVQIRRL